MRIEAEVAMLQAEEEESMLIEAEAFRIEKAEVAMLQAEEEAYMSIEAEAARLQVKVG